jgi:hypothetical protein
LQIDEKEELKRDFVDAEFWHGIYSLAIFQISMVNGSWNSQFVEVPNQPLHAFICKRRTKTLLSQKLIIKHSMKFLSNLYLKGTLLSTLIMISVKNIRRHLTPTKRSLVGIKCAFHNDESNNVDKEHYDHLLDDIVKFIIVRVALELKMH